jgi:hypothetical protein
MPDSDEPTDWQVLLVEEEADALVADLVPLAAEQTGLLSIRLGVTTVSDQSVLRDCLQHCAESASPVTLRWVDGDAGGLLLLSTADGTLVVTACDRA